jgi:hypothetical protein
MRRTKESAIKRQLTTIRRASCFPDAELQRVGKAGVIQSSAISCVSRMHRIAMKLMTAAPDT